MAEFTYEVTERIAVLSTNARGWERQLNMVSWNGNPPKYDIRDWSPDGSRMAKGISLTEEELKPLVDAWRQSNPRIVKFWWDVDRAAPPCVRDRVPAETHGIRFLYQSGMMFIVLPSGRKLVYVKPKMGVNRYGSESVTYEGVGEQKKWLRLESYKKMFHTLREKTGSLSATEAFSADVIHLLGRPTLGQFAATLGISQPNATYKVNNLVAKGYLEKIPGEDRREVRLQTAGKFNAYYHDNEQALREAMDALAGRFSPEELDAAERVMQALVQTVETEKGD